MIYPQGSGTAIMLFGYDNNGRRTDTWLQTNATHSAATHLDSSGRVTHVVAEQGPATAPTTVVNQAAATSRGRRPGVRPDRLGRRPLEHPVDQGQGDRRDHQLQLRRHNRLTKDVVTGGANPRTYTYGYDAAGNRLTAVVTGTSPSSHSLTYNSATRSAAPATATTRPATDRRRNTAAYNTAGQQTSTYRRDHHQLQLRRHRQPRTAHRGHSPAATLTPTPTAAPTRMGYRKSSRSPTPTTAPRQRLRRPRQHRPPRSAHHQHRQSPSTSTTAPETPPAWSPTPARPAYRLQLRPLRQPPPSPRTPAAPAPREPLHLRWRPARPRHRTHQIRRTLVRPHHRQLDPTRHPQRTPGPRQRQPLRLRPINNSDPTGQSPWEQTSEALSGSRRWRGHRSDVCPHGCGCLYRSYRCLRYGSTYCWRPDRSRYLG